MIGIIVMGHGHFASGLASSLHFIAGTVENVFFVDFEIEQSANDLRENLHRAMEGLSDCDGILILCDLAGGSPFVNAVEWKYECIEQKTEVIAGVNFPMLIEAVSKMTLYDDPLELAEVVVSTGKECIVRFEMKKHEDDTEINGI